jgi:cytochrome c biogenesis protein CcdA
MGKKKTLYIWALIISEIINIISILSSFFDKTSGNTIINSIGYVLSILGLVIAVVWLQKAFLLKNGLIKWTHINFGFGLFATIFSAVLIYANSSDPSYVGSMMLVAYPIGIIIAVIIWATFIRHLKKAIATNRIQLEQ